MATIKETTSTIEIVDSDQELILQCATIQNCFESLSPKRDQRFETVETSLYQDLPEDELRKIRGTIIDKKTNRVVCNGGVFPYEYSENDENKFMEKMTELNHKLEDMDVGYSFEGTVIRIFYHGKWYISTHRKLDSGRSKWGSNNSFKDLFENALKENYNLSLKDLFTRLNLRCQYTFMLMADENTRFVCSPKGLKKVYFLGSTDPEDACLKIDGLPKPKFEDMTITSIFGFVKGLKYPFDYQGILLTHTSGSQYRIMNEEYIKLFKVRNNEQSIPYRYLQLKTQNNQEMIELLKQLYPQYISTFNLYDENISKLVDLIFQEYDKRKQRSLLPENLQTVVQIDQRVYLFIKNKLINKGIVTPEKILDLLLLEEASNLNNMIKVVKMINKHEKEAQKLVIDLNKVDLNKTPNNPIPESSTNAPKKKRVKYTKVPNEFTFTCRRELF